MTYRNTILGKFIDRPNRFIAYVEIDGRVETVHVKNTGRCRELLYEGVQVVLEECNNPNRKTGYDLIAVYKESLGWVNIDSQVPNKIAGEWLESGNSPFGKIDFIKPEYVYGNSRIDFYLECGMRKILIEVKGCTLERNGIGYFPDAPTERGVKHLKELSKAAGLGFECYILFVIAMPGVTRVYPETDIHPEFGAALNEAKAAGVRQINLPCNVTPCEITFC